MHSLRYIILLILLASLLISSCAASDIPRTPEEIREVAKAVLQEEILLFMEAGYSSGETSDLHRNDLRYAARNYPEYPRRIVDTTGKTITIVRPLERIVAYNSHWVTPLNQDEKIVGVASSAVSEEIINPHVVGKINIGGGGPNMPDLERIYACNPDAIITYVTLGPGDEFFVDKMPKSVKVIRMDFLEPAYVRDEILKIGYLLDCQEEADAYLAWHDSYVREITKRTAEIPDDERIRVFIDVGSTGGADRRTAPTGTYMSTHCVDGGGINIAADLITGSTGVVNTEWIAFENPDAILALCYGAGYGVDDSRDLTEHYRDITSHQILSFTPALQEDRVYIISYRYAYGLEYPAALATIAKWFYPDRFADLNPQSIHQEYIDRFIGADYDVTARGVFAYPNVG